MDELIKARLALTHHYDHRPTFGAQVTKTSCKVIVEVEGGVDYRFTDNTGESMMLPLNPIIIKGGPQQLKITLYPKDGEEYLTQYSTASITVYRSPDKDSTMEAYKKLAEFELPIDIGTKKLKVYQTVLSFNADVPYDYQKELDVAKNLKSIPDIEKKVVAKYNELREMCINLDENDYLFELLHLGGMYYNTLYANTYEEIKKGVENKMAMAANRYFGDANSNFGLSIKATYDDGKSQELSFKFSEKYRKLISLIKSIYDLVDKIAGAKDAREASETLPLSLMERRNLMSLSLIPPAPSVGVEWKYVYEQEKIGLELAGKVKIAPFIGGELKIDLIALADKIPIYGKLMTALDIATWIAEKIALNRLSISYRIDLTFYANLALEEAFIKWNDAKPKGEKLDVDMNISGTLGGKLDIIVDTKAKVVKDVELYFEAGVSADCYFKITASPNANADNIIDWTTKFSGLILKVTFNVGIKRGKSNNREPKELDPFPLIPSYTAKPLSMVFGEGKTNKN